MNTTDYTQIESSQRQHYATLEHEVKMEAYRNEADYKLFSMLMPQVSHDGNQYCILYGVNLHDGIAGFGDTIHEAIKDFNSRFHEQIKVLK